MEELIKELEKTVSPSQDDQNKAVQFIESYIQRDFSGFLKHLSDILFETNNQPTVRLAAGLQLRNQLTARDEITKLNQQDKWRTLSPETRLYIKEKLFQSLGTETSRPSSAPQCVANIAIIELPEQQWPGLMNALVQNVTSTSSSDSVRLSTLEAIGYICQEIKQTCITPDESNGFLTAIVSGMKHIDNNVKFAAITAASNYFEDLLKNVSKTRQSITYDELSQLLNIECEYAEKTISQMIRDDKIQGYLNQIERTIYFETDDYMHLFNEDILQMCSDINTITEKIRNIVPDEWWIANYSNIVIKK